MKEARKRGWESQQRLTHRRWESGPGVYTEIPDVGRSRTHPNKHAPVAGTSAGPQKRAASIPSAGHALPALPALGGNCQGVGADSGREGAKEGGRPYKLHLHQSETASGSQAEMLLPSLCSALLDILSILSAPALQICRPLRAEAVPGSGGAPLLPVRHRVAIGS